MKYVLPFLLVLLFAGCKPDEPEPMQIIPVKTGIVSDWKMTHPFDDEYREYTSSQIITKDEAGNERSRGSYTWISDNTYTLSDTAFRAVVTITGDRLRLDLSYDGASTGYQEYSRD